MDEADLVLVELDVLLHWATCIGKSHLNRLFVRDKTQCYLGQLLILDFLTGASPDSLLGDSQVWLHEAQRCVVFIVAHWTWLRDQCDLILDAILYSLILSILTVTKDMELSWIKFVVLPHLALVLESFDLPTRVGETVPFFCFIFVQELLHLFSRYVM